MSLVDPTWRLCSLPRSSHVCCGNGTPTRTSFASRIDCEIATGFSALLAFESRRIPVKSCRVQEDRQGNNNDPSISSTDDAGWSSLDSCTTTAAIGSLPLLDSASVRLPDRYVPVLFRRTPCSRATPWAMEQSSTVGGSFWEHCRRSGLPS
jgi:hypothetical protein